MDNAFYAHLSPGEQFDVLRKAVLSTMCEGDRNYCLQNNVLPVESINVINENIFYDIPFQYGFRITQNGRVADLYKLIEITHTVNKTGYPAVTVRKDNTDRSITAHVHRLLALTFLPPTDRRLVDDLQMNHIDGVKTNFSLNNLEWVTQQRNCKHAYETDLREDNTPITITCASTANSFTVYSMAEAGRFFGVTAAAIHWQLNEKKSNTPYKGYYLSYANKNLILQEVITE